MKVRDTSSPAISARVSPAVIRARRTRSGSTRTPDPRKPRFIADTAPYCQVAVQREKLCPLNNAAGHWYARIEGAAPTHRNVYHDRSECRYGQEIKRDRRDVLGMGGRPRCDECKRFG